MHRFIRFAPIALLTFAGCKTTDPCLEIDGPCVGPAQTRIFVVGIPETDVIAGGRAVLHVGESITLTPVHAVDDPVRYATDTLTSATLSLQAGVSAARIVALPKGRAQLTAVQAGDIGRILVDGALYPVYACRPIGTGISECGELTSFTVVP